MKITYPTPQQEAEVSAKAKLFSAAYARFRRPLEEQHAPALQPPLAFKQLFAFQAMSTVEEFDWRDKINIPKAQDQGACYSCSSFAISAAIEIQARIKNPSSTLTVRAQHMHTCIAYQDSTDPKLICNSGIPPGRLLKLLKEHPYATGVDDGIFPSTACATASTHAIVDSYRIAVTDSSAATAKSQLLQGPVITDMNVWNDFFSYTTTKSAAYRPDTSTGGPALHSVCVIGFNDRGWIIKNSLGTGWGDGSGFGTIAYGYCGLIGGTSLDGSDARPAYVLAD